MCDVLDTDGRRLWYSLKRKQKKVGDTIMYNAMKNVKG